MNKKNYLKKAISKNIFDKDMVLDNAIKRVMPHSDGVKDPNDKFIYIKEFDKPADFPKKLKFLTNLAACVIIFAMITGILFAVQKTFINNLYLKGDIYTNGDVNFDEIYNNLNELINNTLNVESGEISFSEEITFIVDDMDWPDYVKGNVIFNKVSDDKYEFDYFYQYYDYNGTLPGKSLNYKYFSDVFCYLNRNGEIWLQNQSPDIGYLNYNSSSMKMFFDIYNFEKNDIDSIEIISNETNTVYKVIAGSDNILYTVDPYGMKTQKLNLNFKAKNVSIEKPHIKTDFKITDSENNVVFDKYDFLCACASNLDGYVLNDYADFSDSNNRKSYLAFHLNDNGISKLETVLSNYSNVKLRLYLNDDLLAESCISAIETNDQSTLKAIYLNEEYELYYTMILVNKINGTQ